MIKPRVKVIHKGGSLPQLQALFKQFGNAYVTVGFDDDAEPYPNGASVVQVALWNEFGTAPQNGAPGIPARPFMRTAIQNNRTKINQIREQVLRQVIAGKMAPQKALEIIGYRVQVMIQEQIKSNMGPANSPRTEARKKKAGIANHTLMETEHMLRSVTFKVMVPGAVTP